VKALALALALLAVPGCGTVIMTVINDGEPVIYGGVVGDGFAMITDPLMVLPALVDLPLSLTADTVLLPWALAAKDD
jgi:uncharacterized protein YceK